MLNPEGAGLIGRLLLVDIDALNPSGRGAISSPADELFHGFGRTLDDRLNAAFRLVAYPSAESQSVSLTPRVEAKPYSLYVSMNCEPDPP